MYDAEIIEKVLAGEISRFGELVDRYLPMVRALCASHVYEAAAHEDLVQEAFVSGYLKLRTLRDRDRFGPWLARIARNNCKSWLRSRKRQSESYSAVARETTTSQPSPLSEIAARELTQVSARRDRSSSGEDP